MVEVERQRPRAGQRLRPEGQRHPEQDDDGGPSRTTTAPRARTTTVPTPRPRDQVDDERSPGAEGYSGGSASRWRAIGGPWSTLRPAGPNRVAPARRSPGLIWPRRGGGKNAGEVARIFLALPETQALQCLAFPSEINVHLW
jgi:hypothetical protein